MVKKEVPFRSLKVTLSSEALSRLDYIVKEASFRSHSSGVEECIRAVYDVIAEIYSVAGKRGQPKIFVDESDQAEAFNRIVMRMTRFTGRFIGPRQEK